MIGKNLSWIFLLTCQTKMWDLHGSDFEGLVDS